MALTQLISIVILLGHGHLGHSFFMSFTGSLTAEGGVSLFYVGENMTLHCHKNTNFTTPEVYFKIGNDVIDQQFVTRINNTDARLVKPVTGADWEEAVYYCNDSSLIGKLSPLYTDYRPQNATDIEMVWLEKNTLIFTWKFGDVRYKNSHTDAVIRVSSEYRSVLNDGFGQWQPCSSATNTSCTVDGFSDIDAIVSLRVTITNVKRGETMSTISPGLIVRDHGKPYPVVISSLKVLSSSSVHLNVTASWNTMNYRINYCAINHSANKCGVTETGLTTEKSLTVHKLHPSYMYTFHVQAKFNTGGFFSDDSNAKTDTMWEDAPSQAPVITPGSFYLDRTTCSKTDHPTATAYIYFQEIDQDHQNGLIRNYTGEVRTNDSHTFSVSTKTGSEHTLKVDNVDCRQGFNISLYGSTDVGRSPAVDLAVPAWNEDLYNRVTNLDLWVKVKDSDEVTAQWEEPDQQMADVTLMIYYCSKDANVPSKCVEGIRHTEVQPQARQQVLSDADGSMMFGLAALTPGGVTTGIITTNCFYNPDKSLGEVISRVLPTGLVDSIEVSWEGLPRCGSSELIIIINYVLHLCLEKQESVCKEYVVDGRDKRANLADVSHGTLYTVQIQANTTSGLTAVTRAADPVKLMEQSGGLSDGAIGGIVSAAFLVCIVAGALIYYFCSHSCVNHAQFFRLSPSRPKELTPV